MDITTHRTMAASCPVGDVCSGVHTVAERPGRTYLISKTVEDDPEVLAAFADKIGPGETLTWTEAELFKGWI